MKLKISQNGHQELTQYQCIVWHFLICSRNWRQTILASPHLRSSRLCLENTAISGWIQNWQMMCFLLTASPETSSSQTSRDTAGTRLSQSVMSDKISVWEILSTEEQALQIWHIKHQRTNYQKKKFYPHLEFSFEINKEIINKVIKIYLLYRTSSDNFNK